MKRSILIAAILAITFSVTVQEATVEILTDSSNTTQKNEKFEPRNQTFGEIMQAVKSPVATTTEILVTTTVPPVTSQAEPIVSTTTEPLLTTKVESLPITTAEQQSTTEREQLVSTTTEPVTTIKVGNSTQNVLPSLNNTPDGRRQTVTSATESTTVDEENGIVQCRVRVYEPPDLSASGRRISQQKCLLYAWDINSRKLRRDDIADCIHSLESEPGELWVDELREILHPAEFPHMGALGWKSAKTNWAFKCGSALISEKFLLTAAHCVTDTPEDGITDPEPKIVRLGTTDLTIPQSESEYEIAKVIVHPMYYHYLPEHHFDIALIELKTDVKFNPNIHPACLWSSSDSDIEPEVFLTGWGPLKISIKFQPRVSSIASQKLQVGNIEVIDSETCDKSLEPYHNRRWRGLQEHEICAGNASGGIDICQGDSSGILSHPVPLPKNETSEKMKYIVGVTSFYFDMDLDCALEDTPGIFTRVSSVIDWIEDIVWPQ